MHVTGTTQSDGYTLKEGIDIKLKLRFIVENQIVSGLKFVNATKRAGMTVDKEESVLGSYGPNAEPQEWTSRNIVGVPSGMLGRGTYTSMVRLTDDSGNEWLSFPQKFKVTK